jgi:hypothetical protein
MAEELAEELDKYGAMFFETVAGRDAVDERTGMYLTRVSKNIAPYSFSVPATIKASCASTQCRPMAAG